MTRLHTLFALVPLTLGLAACGDKEESDDTAGGGDDGSGAAPLTPSEGPWTSSQNEVSKDECGFFSGDDTGDTGGDDDPATITMTGESTFTLDFPDDSEFDLVNCTLTDSSGAFTCESLTQSNVVSEDLDATINLEWTFSGTFTNDTSGTMQAVIDATCEGTDCELVAQYAEITFPCGVEVSFDIAYAG